MNKKAFELLLSAFLDGSEKIKSKHPKYGSKKNSRRRGRGRGYTYPYLLKCKRKAREGWGLSGCWFDEDKGRYCFYSYNSSYLRNVANRHVRRFSGDVGNHAFYRKIYDYAWECV